MMFAANSRQTVLRGGCARRDSTSRLLRRLYHLVSGQADRTAQLVQRHPTLRRKRGKDIAEVNRVLGVQVEVRAE